MKEVTVLWPRENFFGDAMRASTIRMGAEGIDAIPFFSQR